MSTSPRTSQLFLVGVPLLAFALFFQNVTVAGGDYRNSLLAALVFTALADTCLIVALRRGGLMVRLAAIVLLAPTIFIVADFIRRAPGLFR